MKKQINIFSTFIVKIKTLHILWSLAFALLIATAPAAAQEEQTEDAPDAQVDDDTQIDDDPQVDDFAEAQSSTASTATATTTVDISGSTASDSASQPEAASEVSDMSPPDNNAPSVTDDPEDEEKSNSSKAAAFLDTVGIRKLPSDAFPTYKTRGIKGGSLWRTFHGLQWPYMARSGIGVSGTVWVDTGYEKIDRSESSQASTKYLIQEGRAVLRMTPTYTRNRWFIQGQIELIANKDQTVTRPQVGDTDDLWVRLGMWNRFDIQAGRFEAWELYHLGMGLDLNTQERRGAFESTSGLAVPDIYGVTGAYYRPSGPGNIAAHFYPADVFRFELLGQLGNEGGLNTGAFRGAGILDFGFLKLKGGGEYKVQIDKLVDGKEKRHQRGVGGTAQFVISKYLEFGGSYGWSITDHMDSKGYIDQGGSFTTWSAGGFLNARIIRNLLIGGGAHYTFLWDTHKDEQNKVGEFGHFQAFGAIQYLLMDRLYIKAVCAFAKGDFAPSFTETDSYSTHMISGRLRLQYDF